MQVSASRWELTGAMENQGSKTYHPPTYPLPEIYLWVCKNVCIKTLLATVFVLVKTNKHTH